MSAEKLYSVAMPESAAPHCPMQRQCGSARCGGLPEDYFHPLKLAEELCPKALLERHDPYNEHPPLAPAWNTLEAALAWAAKDSREARKLFASAAEQFTLAKRSHSIKQSVQAQVVTGFLPAFKNRLQGRKPSTPAKRSALQALGNGMDTLLRHLPEQAKPYSSETQQSLVGLLGEYSVAALLIRVDKFVYPASDREDHGRHLDCNHDLYALRNGKKSSIQVKYDNKDHIYSIPTVRYLAVVAEALGSYQEYKQANRFARGRYMSGLLLRQIAGKKLTEIEMDELALTSNLTVKRAQLGR